MVTHQTRQRGRPPAEGLGDRRRKQLVEAAYEAFTEAGYEQSTISDIAKRAGVGAGTVYRYFISKRELLDDVFDRAVERLVELLGAEELLHRASAGEIDLIVELGSRLYDLVDRESALIKLLAVQAPAVDQELKQRVMGLHSMVAAYLMRAFAEGQYTGLSGADSEYQAVLTRLLPALIIPGFVLQQSRHDNPGTRKRFVGTAAHLAAHGVLHHIDSIRPAPSTTEIHSLVAGEPGDVSMVTGADRRHDLLDGALTCFIRDGYHATGVDEIVSELGVSHGTFYNYYKSKRDVLDAVIDREFALLEPALPRVGGISESADDVEQIVAHGLSRALGVAIRRAPMLVFVAAEAPGVDAAAFAGVSQLFRFAATHCEQYLNSVIGAGRLHPSVDSEFLGQGYLSLLVGALAAAVDTERTPTDISGIARHTAHFLLFGVGQPDEH